MGDRLWQRVDGLVKGQGNSHQESELQALFGGTPGHMSPVTAGSDSRNTGGVIAGKVQAGFITFSGVFNDRVR